ncbi:MAG: GWxTD domain-containing protein [Terriglobia bacterium]|jgi:GWxTD domain-containing protein
MTFLEMWVATPLAQALGWTLLHSLWEGAIVAAGLVATLLAVRSARARYAAACVAMLVMLGGIVLTLVRMMPEGVHGLHSAGAPGFPAWVAPTDMDGAAPSSPGLAAIVPWLAPFWMVGVWIFVLGQVAGWISVGRLRRRGVCYASERWQKELARLRAQLCLSRPVLLLESCLADIPMVIGHVRPVILMPVGLLAGLPAGQIEAILLHELAHIRRYDYLVNVLQRSVECLLFYHPAVWWISRVMRAERENCCDDVVVATSGNVQEYAVALATLEQNRWSGREPVVAASGGSLMKRIRRLLSPKGANSLWTPLFAAVILITTAVVALAAWPAKPLQQSSAAPPPQAGHAEISAYDRWLNQEVPYIITDTERTACKKLTTDEERDEFIKAFWERRNPNPGSPRNEFREQHYRRLAYANQHYASGRPGWVTDRGRIYIVYGPPDEVDSHPSGGSYERPASEGGGKVMTYPYEDWRYAHFQGIGRLTIEFVDVASSGEFHMTLDPKEKYKKP